MRRRTWRSQTLTLSQALADSPVESGYLYENGVAVFDFPLTSLDGPDPTKVSGEEHFIVHALPDGDITQLHTIELLTETPFGIDRLDHIIVRINRVLKIRASLTSIK